MQQNLYEILQVSSSADREIIQVAYEKRKALLEGRADMDAQNELKIVHWAYETLTDQKKRADYDATLSGAGEAATTGAPYTLYYQEVSSTDSARPVVAKWTLIAIFVIAGLIGIKMYFEYLGESRKNDIEEEVVDAIGKGETKRIENEEKTAGVKYDLARQEQLRKQKELEYQANERGKALDMQRQQQEARLDMQRQQMEQQRYRDETAAKRQKELDQQRRLEREQRFYTCYNAAWSRHGGDGAKATADCVAYK